MSAKSKGTHREHRSMNLLEKSGYKCTRSAASLGCWDIVGVGSTDFILVQVKSRDWPGTLEMTELKEFPAPPNCKKIIHRWKDYDKYPDIKEI